MSCTLESSRRRYRIQPLGHGGFLADSFPSPCNSSRFAAISNPSALYTRPLAIPVAGITAVCASLG